MFPEWSDISTATPDTKSQTPLSLALSDGIIELSRLRHNRFNTQPTVLLVSHSGQLRLLDK
jgi:hypothetical protein